jgi:hypothetical protein
MAPPIARDRWELMGLRDSIKNAQRSLRTMGSQKVQLLNLKPYFERACRDVTPYARGLVMGKLSASGVDNETGTLKAALNKVFLSITWKGDRPVLKLALPAGLGEAIYRRIWSLDRGWKNEDGKVKGKGIFTLSRSERANIGARVNSVAKSYMEKS